MSKITRVTQKLFGILGSSGNFGKFGSKAAGSAVYTQDPTTIQALTAFTTNGWADAVVDGNVPELEDMNGLFLLAFYQIAYLLQQGIAEWDSSTTYYINSIVQYNGRQYTSIQDNNINNQPDTQPSYWGTVGVQPGVVQDYAGDTAPSGYLICDGAAVSRTTYAALFSVCGIKFGAGNGTTTFNIPDHRERVSVGYKSGSTEFGTIGQTFGEKNHTLTIPEIPAHDHTYDYVAISGNYNGSASPVATNPTTGTTGQTGGGGSHNNIQPSITMNKIIKT